MGSLAESVNTGPIDRDVTIPKSVVEINSLSKPVLRRKKKKEGTIQSPIIPGAILGSLQNTHNEPEHVENEKKGNQVSANREAPTCTVVRTQ